MITCLCMVTDASWCLALCTEVCNAVVWFTFNFRDRRLEFCRSSMIRSENCLPSLQRMLRHGRTCLEHYKTPQQCAENALAL